jgi:phage shock protein PspC (stress-responsive transcriptional regulator)
MTTTDQPGGYGPPPFTAPLPPRPALRRSRTDRVGAGVAGGLGKYFAVDPVLFRVLFATAAFFGGAGVLAYLAAWAAIPEEGTAHAPIDSFISELRRRRIPVWLVAAVAGLVLWGVAFSWWAPGHFFPVIAIAALVVAVLSRKGRATQRAEAMAAGGPPPSFSPTVNLAKGATGATTAGETGATAPLPDPASGSPAWVNDTRQWITEAKAARRARRRRAMPVRLATLATLGATLLALAIVDATSGVAIPVYFWAMLVIVGTGVLAGLVLRRTPWSVALLLAPAIVGLVAFGGSHARMHDGFGDREWTPTSAARLQSHYRLAFGRATLDLRRVGPLERDRTVQVTLGAGQARIFVPAAMNVVINDNVRFGDLVLDGTDLVHGDGGNNDGFNLNKTIFPPAAATGPRLTVDVHVTDGVINVDRR